LRVDVAEMRGRGARSAGAVAVPVGGLEVDVAGDTVGALVDVADGASTVGAADVALGVVASVGVAVGATGVRVLVFVARTLGLGVRKSYVSVPTRCGGFGPGVNVGSAV
jgi:hypothetical protein